MTSANVCFILGASGATGKSLIRVLLQQSTKYEKIILLSRRLINFDGLENICQVKIEQRIVDFQCIDKHKNDFSGGKTVFCCIGSSLSKASKVSK